MKAFFQCNQTTGINSSYQLCSLSVSYQQKFTNSFPFVSWYFLFHTKFCSMEKIIERYKRFSDADKGVNEVQQDVLASKFSKYLWSHHHRSCVFNSFQSVFINSILQNWGLMNAKSGPILMLISFQISFRSWKICCTLLENRYVKLNVTKEKTKTNSTWNLPRN